MVSAIEIAAAALASPISKANIERARRYSPQCLSFALGYTMYQRAPHAPLGFIRAGRRSSHSPHILRRPPPSPQCPALPPRRRCQHSAGSTSALALPLATAFPAFLRRVNVHRCCYIAFFSFSLALSRMPFGVPLSSSLGRSRRRRARTSVGASFRVTFNRAR